MNATLKLISKSLASSGFPLQTGTSSVGSLVETCKSILLISEFNSEFYPLSSLPLSAVSVKVQPKFPLNPNIYPCFLEPHLQSCLALL